MPRFNSAPVLNPGDSINRGLVGFWPLNHAAGGIARDLSPFARHGTLVNFGYTSTSGWATGRTGRVLNFDGSNDYISVERIPPLPYITVSCWLKANGSNSSFIISKNFSGTVPFQLSPAPSGTYGGFAFYGGPWICTNVATDIRNDGKWHHVAGTFDGATLKYYIDGRLDASASYSGTLPSNTAAMTIGVYLNDGGFFTGPISALRIHNRALSVSELARLYRDPWAGTLRRRRLVGNSGASEITGAGAATLGTLTGAGAATLAIAGAAAKTLGAVTASGAATVAISASGAKTLAALTAAGAGAVAITGTGAKTLGTLAGSGAATLGIAGQGAITLGALGGAGGAVQPITGAQGGTLGALQVSGAAAVGITGAGSATLGALTCSASAGGGIVASGAVTLGALTGAGAAAIAVAGAAAGSLGALSGAGAVALAIQASAAASLAALTGQGAATISDEPQPAPVPAPAYRTVRALLRARAAVARAEDRTITAPYRTRTISAEE